MNKKLIRSFNFEVRAEQMEGHGNIITGRAIVFDSPTDIGDFTEVIDKNALAETDLRDVRFLVNHNTDMIPLARSRNNNVNSTMQLMVGEEGLDIRADLDTENNADARALYSATERGDISGMSFMMLVDGEQWDWTNEEHPVRRITSISKVLEVSATTWPAYESSSLEARGNAEALESAKATLESAKAEAKAEEEKQADIEKLNSILDELDEGEEENADE